MQVKFKADYYHLREHNCLGNTLRNWRNEHDAYASGVDYFGLREIGSAGGGKHDIVRQHAVLYTAQIWRDEGRQFVIDEAAPDSDAILQGEICQTFRGWEGILGVRTGQRMRDSIRLGLLKPATGLRITTLLDLFLDPSSRDDIDALFQLYPEATIEFTTYPYDLGKIPGRNTIIWEVRDY